MGKLFFLFIGVPVVELVLLIEVGKIIGLFPTVGLIFSTGILGATLARWQGLNVLRRVQGEFAAGRLPTESLVDGVIILLAAAVLITPGVLTDLVGFLCLVPVTRKLIKRSVWKRIERGVRQGHIHVGFHADGQTPNSPPGVAPSAAQRTEPPSTSGRVVDVEVEFEDAVAPGERT